MKLLNTLKSAFFSLHDLKKLPQETLDELNKQIRLKAIKNVKEKLIQYRKNIEDFSENDIEDLIATEEKEIKNKITKGGLSAALSILGLNIFQ